MRKFCRWDPVRPAGSGAALRRSADAVTDWNQITVDAVTVGRPGPIGIVDIALVQVAVHDAVQAIEKRFEPYHFEVERASGRRSAAVAAAAHDVLVGMYPAQAATLDPIYSQLPRRQRPHRRPRSRRRTAGSRPNPSLAARESESSAAAVRRQQRDRRLAPDAFVPGQPARARAVLTDGSAVDGDARPFTLTSPTRFRAEPPPALTSERYTKDYKEVKAFGSLTSTARSAEQTDLAYFYSGNIPAQWNSALRGIATRYLRRTGDSARLLALANMATADALITSWDSKTHYVFWRPVTAIVEAGNDGNPHTVADASWQPLINNSELSRLHVGREQRGRRDDAHAGVVLRYQPHDVRCDDRSFRKPCARRERIAASRTPRTIWSRPACCSASTFGLRTPQDASRDDR